MNKTIYIAAMALASALSVASCSDEKTEPLVPTDPIGPSIDERPVWTPVNEEQCLTPPMWRTNLLSGLKRPDWQVDLTGDDPAPQWTEPDAGIYPSSMTAIVALSETLAAHAGEGDVMAAFIGDECRGIATPVSDNGVTLYFMMVMADNTESRDVVFRYYNAALRTLLSADDGVRYEINRVYGTASSPALPTFDRSGKYPVMIESVLAVDSDDLAIDTDTDDMLAAFVGDECRGVGELVGRSGTAHIYHLRIHGRAVGETVEFRYYSTRDMMVLTDSENRFVIKEGMSIGTETLPYALTFKPDNMLTAYLMLPGKIVDYASEADRLAVFSLCDPEHCRGVGEYMGDWSYSVDLCAADGEEIVFRYYCDRLHRIFDSETIVISGGNHIGQPYNPSKLQLVTDGTHPLVMDMVFVLPPDLASVAGAGDMMAAFVGDECRGVAKKEQTVHGWTYRLKVTGALDVCEAVTLRYYNAAQSHIYTSTGTYDFDAATGVGSEAAPVILTLAE